MEKRAVPGRSGPIYYDAGPEGGTVEGVDGASIVVEDGVHVTSELRIVLIATSTEQPVAQHMRNLIHLGKGSSLRLTVAVIGAIMAP